MRRLSVGTAAVLLLGGCAEMQAYEQAGAELRRQMNDQQAKSTMLLACDISVGAYYRLTPTQRTAVALLCGGQTEAWGLPARLVSPEPAL